MKLIVSHEINILKRIVIVNQDSGYLAIDIANALTDLKLDVSLIAGRLVVRDKKLADSVEVLKIVKYNRKNKFRRFLSWVFAFFQILFIVKTKYRNDYLLIFTNPPFSTFLPLFCNNAFSLMIYDVYPDVMTQMRILHADSVLAKLWKRTNKKVFAKARNIFTLTESMSALIRNYCGDKMIHVIPIWSNSEFFKPIPKELNPFVDNHNLINKFVILYSGNLGATHNIQSLPEIAEKIRNCDIVFLIIGQGDRKGWLVDEVARRNIRNCILLNLQPVENISYSFASADLAIVSLGTSASLFSIPSKTFDFMSAGLPLLCIAGDNSELNRLVMKYDNGLCFPPDQIEKIVSFIEEMAVDKKRLEHYKANSLVASRDFTRHNAVLIAEAVRKSIKLN